MWNIILPVLPLDYGVPVVGSNLTGSQTIRGIYVGDEYDLDEGPTCAAVVPRYSTVMNANVRMVNPKVDLEARQGFLYALGILAGRRGLDPKCGIILTRIGTPGRKKGDWIIEDFNGDTEGVLTKTVLTDARVVLATALRDSHANA